MYTFRDIQTEFKKQVFVLRGAEICKFVKISRKVSFHDDDMILPKLRVGDIIFKCVSFTETSLQN